MPLPPFQPAHDHHAVGDGADRRADRRRVVDREVRAHAAEDRMRPRVGEARRDARELERRLQEALRERAGRRDRSARSARARRLEAPRPSASCRRSRTGRRGCGRSRRRCRPRSASRRAGGSGRRVRVSAVKSKSEEKISTSSSTSSADSPALLDGVEERALHHAAHRLDADVGDRLGPADLPAAVGRHGPRSESHGLAS